MKTSRELDRPKTLVVPLLPLTTGVVLPGMVVTIALETDEARKAIAAAHAADSAIFVVPKIDGRYARIGTLARVEDAVRLPTRIEVRVIRGLQRAMLGTTVAEVGDAVWVQIEPIEDSAPASERVRELARVYRATVENIVEARGIPEQARQEAERELARLQRTSPQSPEYGWIRTYLDWMTEVPWNRRTEDNLNVAEARRILTEDHTGLEDVKERIIEYLSVRRLRKERGLAETETATKRGSGAILTLIGPPGVGKTSLGESVARALGRKFGRISLGGIHDEAEIRGHRRTYVGALPGRIVRALKDAGTKNPVLMLDEIDKVGADWRGDPSSALLEVLDPAQNHTFR